MKKILTVIFLVVTSYAEATNYYVSTSGNDSNNGTIGSPVLTLSKASTLAVNAGDSIIIASGTYVFSTAVNINVGVSIRGAGDATILQSNVVVGRVNGTSTGSLNLISATDGTNGNQTLKRFKLIGTGTPNGTIGIVVKRRSNVIIEYVTVFDFEINGITFMGGATEFTTGVFATGNQIRYCDVRKCGTSNVPYGDWKNGGAIKWAGQDGMLVHHNYFSNKERAYEKNDNIVSIGYSNKGCKYYNNESYKPDNDGQAWSIHIESWELEGGFEIYNNQFIGGDMAIDCAGHYANKGSYDYTYSIHDNYFAPNSQYGDNYHPINAICIEGLLQQYIFVYNNHFYKHPTPIVIEGTTWGASNVNNIFVFKNLFEACGQNNVSAYDNIMYVWAGVSGSTMNNINIVNNTIISDITRNAGIKIETYANTTLTTLNYRNNIVLNCTNGTFMNIVNNGSLDGLNVTYNLLYGNSNNNLPKFTGNAVTNYTISNNVNLAPLFVGGRDFRLQIGSPAIDAGVIISIPGVGELPYNNNAPDIGYSEVDIITNHSPVITKQSFTVTENSSNGTMLGLVAATDPDVGQSITYSITSGNTSGAFAINSGTGALTVANSSAVNYSVNPSFSLVIRVTDNGSSPLYSEDTITVIVSPIINIAPDISNQSFSLVGKNIVNGLYTPRIVASDINSGQTLSYRIISGNFSSAFIIDPIKGNLMVNNATFIKSRTAKYFDLVVMVTDSGGLNSLGKTVKLSSTAVIRVYTKP